MLAMHACRRNPLPCCLPAQLPLALLLPPPRCRVLCFGAFDEMLCMLML